MANRTIAIQNTFNPESYALYQRMSYGGGFLENNKDVFYYHPDTEDRINDVCGDYSNKLFIDPHTTVETYANGTTGTNIVIGYQFTAAYVPIITTETGTGDYGLDLTYGKNKLNIGDIIVYTPNGVNYTSGEVVGFGASGTGVNPGPAVANNNGIVVNTIFPFYANVNNLQNFFYVIRKNKSSQYTQRNTKLIAYQPPLGIFNISTGITCNSLRLTLNPYNDWYNRIVQILYPNSIINLAAAALSNTQVTYSKTLAVGHYTVTIESLQFYAYMQNRLTPMPPQITLKTLETKITRDILQSGSISKQYAVPATTKFVVIFFADAIAHDPMQDIYSSYSNGGVNGNVLMGKPLNTSDFRSWDNNTATLTTLNIQIGDLKFPKTEYTQISTKIPQSRGTFANGFTELENDMLQRYIDTQNVTGKFFNDAGSESYENWIKSPYYAFNVEQPANSWNTVLYVNANFAQPPTQALIDATTTTTNAANVAIYVVAFYEKVVNISQSSGLVTSVEQSEA